MGSTDLSTTSTTIPPAASGRQLVPSLIPIKLTKENYPLWGSLFIPVLKASNMLDLTEDGVQCPPQTETLAYADWLKRDQLLLTWINSDLSVGFLGRTKGFKSGRALWFHLESLLEDDSIAYVRGLPDRLANLKYYKLLNKQPKKEYIKQARLIADGLEKAGSPVDDSEVVSFVLNGLPDPYGRFATGIRNRSPPVTLDQLENLFEYNYEPPEKLCIALMGFIWFVAMFFSGTDVGVVIFGVYTIVFFFVGVGLLVAMIVSDIRRSRTITSAGTYEKLQNFEE